MIQSKSLLNTEEKYSANIVYLNPGELHIAKKPSLVWTILGSCVSIVFYCPKQQISSICHAQLPTRNMQNGVCSARCPVMCLQDSDPSNEFKYVSCSINYMVKKIQGMGIPKKDILVKLFGGSQVLAKHNIVTSIGEKNIATAKQQLKENNLKIVNENVGGKKGRTIYFYSDTGKILLKKHKN